MYQAHAESAGRSQINTSGGTTRARWNKDEVDELVAFFNQNHSNADGGSFKGATLATAATHIHSKCGGMLKKTSTIQNKWSSLKTIHTGICFVGSNSSGFHWDNDRGANINGPAATEAWNNLLIKKPALKEFRNKGWKYLDQFDAILPGGSASGSRAFVPGMGSMSALLNPTEEVEEDLGHDDFTIPIATLAALPPPPLHTSAALATNMDQDLIGHTISTTATAIGSLSVPAPLGGGPIVVSNARCQSTPAHHSPTSVLSTPFSQTVPTPSTGGSRAKCPIKSISANDAPQAGSMNPLASSASSACKRKCSRNSSNQATAGSMDSTSIALHTVDSSIQHLSDSLSANFVDPFKAIVEAVKTTQSLTSMQLISQEHKNIFLAVIERHPAVAVKFNTYTTDEKHVGWITKVFADEQKILAEGQSGLL